MSEQQFTISVVSKITGVGVETIRYYQRIGLIDKPAKPISGYRTYADNTISRLGFIQRAKQLGFNLSEIYTLLELGDGKCLEAKQLASSKLEIITSKINDLQSMATTLETLIDCCNDNPPQQQCPIISAISKK